MLTKGFISPVRAAGWSRLAR